MNNIFLSAGVPESSDLKYGRTADPLLIHSAIRSLCSLVFGRKQIVWGGHPAITPMMWAACENLGIDYATSVRLFQSRYFPHEMYPEENERFRNVTYVRAGRDLSSSLFLMRAEMIKGIKYEAGVFIGGKGGIEEEFEMFLSAHPKAPAIILPSTGGAALVLSERYPTHSAPAGDFVDFVGYLSKFIELRMGFTGRRVRNVLKVTRKKASKRTTRKRPKD